MKLESLKKIKVFERFDKRVPRKENTWKQLMANSSISEPLVYADPRLTGEKELEDLTLFMERRRKKQRRWEPTNPTRKMETR